MKINATAMPLDAALFTPRPIAIIAKQTLHPLAPKSIIFLRPNFSIVHIAHAPQNIHCMESQADKINANRGVKWNDLSSTTGR